MEPLVAAVWSCDPAVALDYPARYLFAFLDHHGMLGVFGSPQWRTVTGGSREYVAAVAAGLDDVRLGTKVTSVLETADGRRGHRRQRRGRDVRRRRGRHPPRPGAGDARRADRRPSARCSARCRTPATPPCCTPTPRLLPAAARARASWNFRAPAGAARRSVTVTYDLTRLQRLATDTRYLVTLGGEDLVDPATGDRPDGVRAPALHPGVRGRPARACPSSTPTGSPSPAPTTAGASTRTARAPGVAAAERLGLAWPSRRPAAGPGRRGRGRVYRDDDPAHPPHAVPADLRAPLALWLVDLDDLPDHGRARHASRRATTSATRRARSAPTSRRSSPATGVDLSGRPRILMAANARALGHCFNPISVFWCFDGDGRPAATVVEVHNTYGDRHAYLVHPDAQGRATHRQGRCTSRRSTATDGTYESPCRCPATACTSRSRCARDDGAVFSASLAGTPHRRGTAGAPRPAALRGTLLIRAHGIWLWARRLPVRPRPRPPPGRCLDDPRPRPPRRHDLARAATPSRPAPAPRVAAAVARRLFRAAVSRLDVTVGSSPTSAAAPAPRPGRPGDDRAPARRVLRPARPRRADRLRRGLPDRRLGRRGPRRLPHRARRRAADPGPGVAAEAARRGRAPPAAAQRSTEANTPRQHRAPLRPVQRPVRARSSTRR